MTVGTIESAPAVPSHAGERHVDVWCLLAAALGSSLIFALAWNPYWVPGGDSEVYVAIARNLALGNGYQFNGLPVSMVPPGWSAALAGVLLASPTFAAMKLAALASMLGFVLLGYRVCRRFAPPGVCLAATLGTSLLSYVYSLSFWLHSDALFCLLAMGAVLVAMQIREGRRDAWRIALLGALCVASTSVRWAGVLQWPLLAAILLRGSLWPRFDRVGIALALSGAATAGAFFGWRAALAVTPQQQQEIRAMGAFSDDTAADTPPFAGADAEVTVAYSLFNPSNAGAAGYLARLVNWGNWFTYLAFQPARVTRGAGGVPALASLAVGWLMIAATMHAAWRGARRREWTFAAVLLYALALAMNWPHPNARYLVPLAPLILLATLRAGLRLRQVGGWASWRWTCRAALPCFIAALVVCNGALWAVDVRVARRADFYDVYEAGLGRDLIAACQWINRHADAYAPLAVSGRYVNLGRTRYSRFGLRAAAMLTGRDIVSVPLRLCRPPDNRAFQRWADRHQIMHYLYQPDVSPWRVFHFRMPWLQEMKTGRPAEDAGAGWRLYQRTEEGWERVVLDGVDAQALRVLPLMTLDDAQKYSPQNGAGPTDSASSSAAAAGSALSSPH